MSGELLIEGGCHCRKLRYKLGWPVSPSGDEEVKIPARRCSCSFCTRIDGVWTSHPEATLAISEAGDLPPTKYRFATGTADFLFCSQCGITPVVVCEIEGRKFAVVNVNTFDEDSGGFTLDYGDTNFDGESLDDRQGRRKARWIGRIAWLGARSHASSGLGSV